MKKQSPITLSISQPCHESWGEMTTTEQGRFCLNCQKTVTDFTQLSDGELIALLQSKQASTCGRFLPHQLDRVLTVSASVPKKRRKPFISIAAIVAGLTITIPFARASKSPDTVLQTADKENKQLPGEVALKDSSYLISGMIRNDRDSAAIRDVNVTIKNTNIRTMTDQSGKFKLRIPADFKDSAIILEIGYVGYEKKSITIVLIKDLKPIDIWLREDANIMGKWGMQYDNNSQKNHSLWEKFSDAINSLLS